MNMIKKISFILLVILGLQVNLSAAQQATPEEYQLYSQALEKILSEEIAEATLLLNRLLSEYPQTPLRDKAQMYLNLYSHKLDRTGSIPFYLGWLGTGVLATESIPVIFDISSIYLYSGLGIAGVGSGLWAAYALSKDRNMSAGQDFWIESTQALSMLNLFFLLKIGREVFIEPRIAAAATLEEQDTLNDNWWDINYSAQLAVAVASRLITYNSVKDQDPSLGRIGYISLSYAWAHAYYWPIMLGIFQSENNILNYTLGTVIPDALAVGAYYYWEKLGWSFTRSGIVSVGGLAGHVIAGLLNLSLIEMIRDYPLEAGIAVQLGFSLGAKLLMVHLTRNLDSDRKYNSILEASQLMIAPIVTADGFGLQGSFKF